MPGPWPQAARLQAPSAVHAPGRLAGVLVPRAGLASYVGLRKALPLRSQAAAAGVRPAVGFRSRRGALQVRRHHMRSIRA
jgi:hypothetical protein